MSSSSSLSQININDATLIKETHKELSDILLKYELIDFIINDENLLKIFKDDLNSKNNFTNIKRELNKTFLNDNIIQKSFKKLEKELKKSQFDLNIFKSNIKEKLKEFKNVLNKISNLMKSI